MGPWYSWSWYGLAGGGGGGGGGAAVADGWVDVWLHDFWDLWVGGVWWGWRYLQILLIFWCGEREPGTTATAQPVLWRVCFRRG